MRYGNTLLYTDFSMYFFLGAIFVVRSCVQGIGKSAFVLAAGAAELVARITVCLVLPALVNGGPIDAGASELSFFALCAADPIAWVAADLALLTPYIRNILRCDYSYLDHAAQRAAPPCRPAAPPAPPSDKSGISKQANGTIRKRGRTRE